MKLRSLLPTTNQAVKATCALATTLVAATQTQRIFSSEFHVLPMLGVMIACGLGALIVASFHWAARAVGYVSFALVSVVIAVAGADGVVGSDTGRALAHGLGDAMSAVWPSPALPSAVGALAGLASLAAMLAVDFAMHHIAIAALLPSLSLFGMTALLASEAGPPSSLILVVYALTALALLRAQSSMRFSSTRLSLFGAVILILASVPLVLKSYADAKRYNPRESISGPALPDTGISPLARLDEWRTRAPADVVLRSTSPKAQRWRLVGLTRYDGRTWMPSDDYRRTSEKVVDVAPQVVTEKVSVTLGNIDSVWLPSPNGAVRISEPVRVDSGLSAFLASDRPLPGQKYDLVVAPSNVTPVQLAGARAGAPTSPFIAGGEPKPKLLELATTITAGAQTDYERAQRIASYLQGKYFLDDGSPAGHSMVVEELFLLNSHRGRDEQFVAAYGILAAAIGLPVRIAVGFETSADPAGTGTVALSSAATAWPEVNFQNFGWVPFDPIPDSSAIAPNDTGPGGLAPVDEENNAPPPSTLALPPDTLPTTATNDATDSTQASGGGVSLMKVAGFAAFGLLLVAPIAYVLGVLLLKRRRRARRELAPDPRERAIGAFRTGVDILVDLGVSAPASKTDRELVSMGARTLSHTSADLMPVAELATEAVFRPHQMSGSSMKSWQQLDEFERKSREEIGPLRYWRARLSTRSLRRGLSETPPKVD